MLFISAMAPHCIKMHSSPSKKLNWKKFTGHALIEPWNHLGWKKPPQSSSATVNFALPSLPLNHICTGSGSIPKYHTHMSFEYLQGW